MTGLGLIVALCVLAGPVVGQTTISRGDSFTDSTGRTLLYRYWIRSDWDLSEPRGAVLYFHGNSHGTEEQVLQENQWNADVVVGGFVLPGAREALDLGLAVVSPASPFSLPEQLSFGERSLVGASLRSGGTRFWANTDARLIHELLQSGLNSRLAIDYDKVVFSGVSQGTCFLAQFVEYYGGTYGGGFHAWCGCFWLDFDGNDSHDTYAATPPFAESPWSPTFQWTPFTASAVSDRFRVFVEATTEDFLHQAALSMSRYYSNWLGLETRSDLEASGGHCARGITPHGEIIEWLSSGALPGRPGGGADTDGDGTPNASDLDDDNDGAPDFLDALPRDHRDWRDTDGDGIADARDGDADGDGVGNASDAFPLNWRERLDTDGDGIGNRLDADDDNDGLPDASDPQPLVGTDNGGSLGFVLQTEGRPVVGRSGYSVRRRAQVHGNKPPGVAYPATRGHAQSYQFLELGNSSDPRFEIMVDRFSRSEACEAVLVPQLCAIARFSRGAYYPTYYQNILDRIWIDRNRNRDLRDDGPPLLVASNAALVRSDGSNFNPYAATAVLEVPYATGQVLPYAIVVRPGRRVSDGIAYSGASVWRGEVGMPSGGRMSAIAVDGDVDGLFDSQAEDFVCLDLDRDGWLNECSFSEDADGNRIRPNAIRPSRPFSWCGNSYSAAVAPWGQEITMSNASGDDDDPRVSVSFGSPSYQVPEGRSVQVELQLCADPEREVRIPLVVRHLGGSTGADYSGLPRSVTFGSGETRQTFEFRATDDSEEDDGESVVVALGDLPAGVTGSGSTTIVIVDDDTPPVSVIDRTGGKCDGGLCRAVTGQVVSFKDVSTGPAELRRWDFGDGATSDHEAVNHSWSRPGFYAVTLWVSDGRRESTDSLKFLVEASDPAGSCVANAETMCLQNSRFSVTMGWRTDDGQSGSAKVVHEGTNDSGLFRFFERDNWEVLIKVLNGCGLNDHVWVYGASATTLGYSMRVTDTVTGRTKEYRNAPGERAPAITDNKAFPGSCGGGVAAVRSSPATLFAAVSAGSEDEGCTETPATICLQGGRYAVSVGWSKLNGEEGMAGVLRPRTADSGLFYFFDSDNWEMLVKVLNGCSNNGRHWVFAASATDVGLDLVVRDTVTGKVRNYTKEPGEPARAVVDVSAFPEGCQPQ